MLFDAGIWGMVEVDVIDERPDETPPRVIGIKNPDDIYTKIMYHNFGKKLGCSKVECRPPKERSPEIKKKNMDRLMDVCAGIMQRNLENLEEATPHDH